MCKEVLNQSMIHENNGVIVNVTAVVTNGFAGMAHTGAARAGVINLTKSMAIECAHLGIRINCVSPELYGVTQQQRITMIPLYYQPMHLLYRLNGLAQSMRLAL